MFISFRSESEPLLFKLKPINELIVPDGILIGDYNDVSGDLRHIDKNINNLATWFYIKEHSNKMTNYICSGILINCDGSGEVAVIINDDHERTGIFIVYNNIDDYKSDYEKWKSIENKNNTFSLYCIHKFNLPYYYG